MSDFVVDSGFVMGLICGVVLIILVMVLPPLFPNDSLDLNSELAPYLCNQHNLSFNPKVDNVDFNKTREGIQKLTIYCRNESQPTQISDGYLVVIVSP